jgi:Zn ribbon nucleic-acid-binding protein
MYVNGADLGIDGRGGLSRKGWRGDENDHGNRCRQGKRFINCICPKCTASHYVYMLWTGRGVPRKYCGNCKPLISGYDEAAVYEASISAPGQSKKKGRRYEGE